MKLMYFGGSNTTLAKDNPLYDRYGYGNYFVVQIMDELKTLLGAGKKIALCVAASSHKVDYRTKFTEIGLDIDDFILLDKQDAVSWGSYHAILMFGGETVRLYDWLNDTDFSIDKLINCEFVAGDSAGAYVLAKNALVDYSPDGSMIDIRPGFIPELDILVAAHVNNSHYHKAPLDQNLRAWCKDNNSEYVGLKENQQIILEV